MRGNWSTMWVNNSQLMSAGGSSASNVRGQLKQSVSAALQASAINMRDLEMQPPPVARLEASRGHAGGVLIRTTPRGPGSVDIQFIPATGADLDGAHRRR